MGRSSKGVRREVSGSWQEVKQPFVLLSASEKALGYYPLYLLSRSPVLNKSMNPHVYPAPVSYLYRPFPKYPE